MSLNIADIFYSIQGEGPQAGEPSVFIRLQGCNLRCPWCDEPDALPGAGGCVFDVDRLVEETGLDVHACGTVVFTGGEPLLQAPGIVEYLNALHKKHIVPRVWVESNGTKYSEAASMLFTCDPDKPMLHSCVPAHLIISPKDKPEVPGGRTHTAPHPSLLVLAECIKLVVGLDTDIHAEWRKYRDLPQFVLEEHRAPCARRPWLYLQPEDSCRAEALRRCVDYVLAHPSYARLSMRLHKELGVK